MNLGADWEGLTLELREDAGYAGDITANTSVKMNQYSCSDKVKNAGIDSILQNASDRGAFEGFIEYDFISDSSVCDVDL